MVIDASGAGLKSANKSIQALKTNCNALSVTASLQEKN
jgi:hypothetical protein